MSTTIFAGVYLYHLLAIALKALDAEEGEDHAAARAELRYSGAVAHDVPPNWSVSTISIPHASFFHVILAVKRNPKLFQDLHQVGSCCRATGWMARDAYTAVLPQ